jgi:ATP-dependent helicase/nuclease subunit A
MPPAELLDLVLEESAYAVRLAGPRLPYARENLKKIRALIRRIQNRGYTTLARIADHLDRLAVGDEPNAVIDALDAVSLMTVHAAKGLEFPVVCVVNASRGTGNRRDAIRIAGDPTSDAISVAVGDYRSEADEDEAMREREETKRLLYVALTRARDRIYLSTVLKDGRVQPGRGSLAEVWPASLLEAFAGAYAGGDRIDWNTAASVHRFRVVRSSEQPGVPEGSGRTAAQPTEVDFSPVVDAGRSRSSVAAVVSSEVSDVPVSGGAESDLVAGLLVHRLLQRFGMTADLEPAVVETMVTELIRASGLGDEEAPRISREAISRFHALRRHPHLQRDYATGEVFHEVPFTLSADGQMIRGAIDCLIRRPDGSIRVLEFKTGRRREHDALQAEIYRRAAAAVFPDRVIEIDVLYSRDVAES